MRKTIAIACAAAALAAPAAAQAHVTLQPDEAPAGGFTRLDVRVPNERDNASTTKVEVQVPARLPRSPPSRCPAGRPKVKQTKLAKPQTHDEGEKITEQVDTITWTGTAAQGRSAPASSRTSGSRSRSPTSPARA